MKTFLITAAMLIPLLAHAIVPINGGMAPGTTIVINNGLGDQTDPHVSGSIAAYNDLNPGSGVVRYFNFTSGVDLPIPNSSPGNGDTLPNISGNRISFSRQMVDRNALMVFDLSLGTVTEIAPQVGSKRFTSSIGGNTVAVVDQALGGGGIVVADISAPLASPILLSGTPTSDNNSNPSVAPAGNAVVWDRCDLTFTICSVQKSIFSGGAWGAAQVVSSGRELNGRTDGNVVVYKSERKFSTEVALYWQPLVGGAETKLEIVGFAPDARISQGVIAFSHRATSPSPTDIFIYVIATNTIYQVTNTPLVDEFLTDVTVLPGGEVRVVWAANADSNGRDSVFASTFRVPLGAPPTYAQISAGAAHTCAVRGDGEVQCWGSNALAQAPATRRPAAPRRYAAVSAAAVHSCALTDAGEAECWGNNSFGQAPARRAARSGNFTQLSAAGLHNCALRSDGAAECWGWNGLGQAPASRIATLGKFTLLAAGATHTCGLRDDSVVECWGSNALGQAPRYRSPFSAGVYVAVTAGSAHTCATRRSAVPGNDAVECWGANGQGQAPVMMAGRYADVSAGGAHTCGNLITPLGMPALLGCWGNNAAGQAPPTRLPASSGGGGFTALSAGLSHTCAINQASFVECWGDNHFGQAPAQRH